MNDKQSLGSLSRRERDVVDLLLQGKSNKQIALSLGISERTVEFHLNNIYGKLQVASRVELILKLGKATGAHFDNPVESTVELAGRNVDNGNQPARARAAHSWRNTVSLIRKEVVMTIRISFEELENYLRNRPALFGLSAFLIAGLATHYALFTAGLYFWLSYVVLALSLGYGSMRFGWAMKSASMFRPLMWIAIALLIPFLAVGFDQLYLNTVLRYTEPIATSIGNISATAGWITAADGRLYRSTTLSATSDTLWFAALGYMALLFGMGIVSRKKSGGDDLATV